MANDACTIYGAFNSTYTLYWMWFQSIQGKQDSLLQRIDTLDQENEELRGDMAELEEQKESLEEALERAAEEKHTIEKKLKQEQVCVYLIVFGKVEVLL